jgi:hypothetical protein
MEQRQNYPQDETGGLMLRPFEIEREGGRLEEEL